VTLEAQLLIVLSIAIALGTLVGAALIWRRLSAVGAALVELEGSMPTHASKLGAALGQAKERLEDASRAMERASRVASSADDQLEHARASLAAQRAASDRLRTNLIENRANIARIRDAARLRLRLIDMRREYLG
jgi:hypothetical protein